MCLAESAPCTHEHRFAALCAQPKTLHGKTPALLDLAVLAGSMMPGSLVNARIRNVLSDGLLVSFLTYFNGSIDRFHLNHVGSNFIHICWPRFCFPYTSETASLTTS